MARLNARRRGLLQRLSTALLTEFVGGFGKVWIAVSPTANHPHGILPTQNGQARLGWTSFERESADAVDPAAWACRHRYRVSP